MHAVVLRYLDQVARMGSIRRAAETLNVASSALSRQIQKVESEIGAPVFERRGNGVRLTPAGEHLLRHTRNTLGEWQRTCAEIAALAGDIRGEVQLTTIPALLVGVVPRAIEAVARAHPGISYRIVEADPAEHAAELRAGRPDLALLFRDKRHRDYDSVATLRTVLGAIMRPDHPLARAKSVTLTDCAAYPVLWMKEPWLLDAVSEAEFVQSGATFNVRLASNSLGLMKEAMKAGLGIGFFTPTGFVDEIARGELVHVPLAESGVSASELALLVHRERASAPHVAIVAKALASELQALGRQISMPRAAKRRT